MRRRRSGFTLVELLVALVVSALVVSAAFRAVTVAGDATARVREEKRVALRASVARAQLDAWLRAATLLGGAEPFIGTTRPRQDGPPRDEVSFAIADGGALWPGPRRVHLWIDASSAGAGASLLAELTELGGSADAAPDTVLVAPGALGMRLRYRGLIGRFAGWSGEWSSSVVLPDAVELRLVSNDAGPEQSLAPILTVPLIIPVGWGESSGAEP